MHDKGGLPCLVPELSAIHIIFCDTHDPSAVEPTMCRAPPLWSCTHCRCSIRQGSRPSKRCSGMRIGEYARAARVPVRCDMGAWFTLRHRTTLLLPVLAPLVLQFLAIMSCAPVVPGGPCGRAVRETAAVPAIQWREPQIDRATGFTLCERMHDWGPPSGGLVVHLPTPACGDTSSKSAARRVLLQL